LSLMAAKAGGAKEVAKKSKKGAAEAFEEVPSVAQETDQPVPGQPGTGQPGTGLASEAPEASEASASTGMPAQAKPVNSGPDWLNEMQAADAALAATCKAVEAQVKEEVTSPAKKQKKSDSSLGQASGTGPGLGQATKYDKIPEPAKLNYQLKSLAKKGHKDLQEEYKLCKTQDEKRRFYWEKFILDPRSSTKSACKNLQAEESESQTKEKGWYTSDQIAEKKGILPANDRYGELKELACTGLPERPHEDSTLAQAGIKQYYFETTKVEERNSVKKQVEFTETVTDLEADDFDHAMSSVIKYPKPQKALGSKQLPVTGQTETGKPGTGQLPDTGKSTPEDQYKSACVGVHGLLQQVSGLLNRAEMMKAQIMAIESADKASLKQAYMGELDKIMPPLENARKQALGKIAFFGKEAPAAEDMDSAIQQLANLAKTLTVHKTGFTKALEPIRIWLSTVL